MKDENTAKDTREFAIRDIMISHCGENLTPDNVDKIAAEMLAAIETGPCAWAFRHNVDVLAPAGEKTPTTKTDV